VSPLRIGQDSAWARPLQTLQEPILLTYLLFCDLCWGEACLGKRFKRFAGGSAFAASLLGTLKHPPNLQYGVAGHNARAWVMHTLHHRAGRRLTVHSG
jgi:hypothetical protein